MELHDPGSGDFWIHNLMEKLREVSMTTGGEGLTLILNLTLIG